MKPILKRSAIFAILTSASSLQAASIILEGDFIGSFQSGVSEYQGIPSFVGSFQASYDDSSVAESGIFVIESVPLSSLTLTPSTIGSTSFDLINTTGRIWFLDGVMIRFQIGGTEHK